MQTAKDQNRCQLILGRKERKIVIIRVTQETERHLEGFISVAYQRRR